ncbi:sulfur oxidation c-type cytochrome SoxX [Magnetospira sp. QH-2]|uniref:sulfur oxidation c-type cytochrome SoxX n=1 Tax=Magnetospira sp. (strain QH-2) TaxID=1288970 RepID=UPI0003E81283|nr:sulfur oxidation c-type cytochrome SoxX [Magnetospira sp. QH-2]CCQ73761.1 Monoheme cytochrome c sulfur oxidizing protein(SoxX) [Magnetospira sp. QH-2]
MRSKAILGAALALTVTASVHTDARAADTIDFFVVGEGIPEYLAGVAGDAAKGKKTAVARKKGNCLACHKMPIPEEQFHGEVGPDLAGVGSRMSEAELRLRIVDPKITNSESMMPSFYRIEGLNRVMKKHQGKTMLSAQEVEDVVAYLKTLKEN